MSDIDTEAYAQGLPALLKLGAHYFDVVKDMRRAEHIFKRATHDFPDDFRAFFNLGNVYTELGHLEKAVHSYQDAHARSPSTVETYGALSGLLIKLHRPQEATQMCYMGLVLNPVDRTCLYNLNISLRQMGRISEAVAYSWQALRVLCSKKGSASTGETHAQANKSEIIDPRSGSGHMNGSSAGFDHVTFVCVKWGKKYGPEYVNSLYHNIAASNPYRKDVGRKSFTFICYTDSVEGIDSGVVCRAFPSHAMGGSSQKWHGWWLKCCLFAPQRPQVPQNTQNSSNNASNGSLVGWVVYLDLDTVLTGDMDVFNWPDSRSFSWSEDTLYILSARNITNECRSCGMNSSMMIWNNGCGDKWCHLFTFLVNYYSEVNQCIYKFDHYLEMVLMRSMTMREQDSFFALPPPAQYCYIQEICPGRCADFLSLACFDSRERRRSREAGITGEGATAAADSLESLSESGVCVVLFPLQPKPLEASVTTGWVRDYFAIAEVANRGLSPVGVGAGVGTSVVTRVSEEEVD